MKKVLLCILILILSAFAVSCKNKKGNNNQGGSSEGFVRFDDLLDGEYMYIKIKGVEHKIMLEDSKATLELVEILKDGKLTLKGYDNGGFEKVIDLKKALTTSDANITAKAGDVVLYNGNQLCILYKDNAYSYTKIGKVVDLSGDDLKEFLCAGETVDITLSVKDK